ncbi:flagellar type III secretion system pore protein FliP [Pseudomonas otitidis]|uniref:flagellar type III secretion system pore protein FliP n=1 Tax=Metapseudomonas otitidis TaxID=319939 RepID=UPI002448DE8E|nr:flagellar type III secretion system pore protein FliP [Pseudomonas otitidis]MDH1108455.1 flagellar type III secretion system pore protein FliP [Pseudomonas otitidis]MDH1160914.1 flagellar type III secretion system pore protein FliP [Pseudomonas otitidis]MDH1167184.1 flagellar type III secretion system pore protein FliP [Pseudomonas otitidis]
MGMLLLASFPGLCLAEEGGVALGDFTVSQVQSPVSVLTLLTALSFIPFMMIALTTFTRNIVVLSLVRQALGLQQTPPNIVLIVLSLFLTLFVMAPTLEKAYDAGARPFLANDVNLEQAAQLGWAPIRDFMVRQTHESDLRLIYQLSQQSLPATQEELSPVRLIPAFMLSELKIAFQIGFMIFLPFLIIDLIVASILMSLGMIMVPPITISLPLKIMLFLLIDGWGLIAQTLVRSVT